MGYAENAAIDNGQLLPGMQALPERIRTMVESAGRAA